MGAMADTRYTRDKAPLGAENKATLSAKLQAYDAILNKQRYLAGDVNDLYSTTIERDT